MQVARRLLRHLASEIDVNTHRLPLATYPAAIKAVVPLIDEGKIDEAKQALQSALNLLVIDEVVIPLPVLRTKAILKEAEELSNKSDRGVEENQRLANLLDAADVESKLGRALGYFSVEDMDVFYEELAEIRKKTSDGKSGEGFFDKIRDYFSWE